MAMAMIGAVEQHGGQFTHAVGDYYAWYRTRFVMAAGRRRRVGGPTLHLRLTVFLHCSTDVSNAMTRVIDPTQTVGHIAARRLGGFSGYRLLLPNQGHRSRRATQAAPPEHAHPLPFVIPLPLSGLTIHVPVSEDTARVKGVVV